MHSTVHTKLDTFSIKDVDLSLTDLLVCLALSTDQIATGQTIAGCSYVEMSTASLVRVCSSKVRMYSHKLTYTKLLRHMV